MNAEKMKEMPHKLKTVKEGLAQSSQKDQLFIKYFILRRLMEVCLPTDRSVVSHILTDDQ